MRREGITCNSAVGRTGERDLLCCSHCSEGCTSADCVSAQAIGNVWIPYEVAPDLPG